MKTISEEKFDKIYNKCEKIYSESGASSVIEHVEKKRDEGKKNYLKIDYHRCEPCDADMPCLNDTCLVCGSSIEKPVLKADKKTIFQVDSYDFDRFVESIYGGSFEIVAIQELNNNSHISFDVPEKYVLADEKLEAKIRNGEYPNYCTNRVVKCLIEDGYLTEEGEYFVNISW